MSAGCLKVSTTYDIPGDHCFGKVLTTLPTVGLFGNLIYEIRVNEELEKMARNATNSWTRENLEPYLAAIKTKNHYTIATMIHLCLAILIIATLIAAYSPLLSKGALVFMSCLPIVLVPFIIFRGYLLHKQLKAAKDIQDALKALKD